MIEEDGSTWLVSYGTCTNPAVHSALVDELVCQEMEVWEWSDAVIARRRGAALKRLRSGGTAQGCDLFLVLLAAMGMQATCGCCFELRSPSERVG